MPFSLDQLLTFAARSGDVALIRERVALGADPTRSGALLCAVSGGHIEAIDALMELGADIGARDRYGYGPIEYALRKRDAPLVLHLVHRGATLAKRSRDHWRSQLEDVLSSAPTSED